MIKVCQATSAEQLEAVRGLMRAFSEWHYDRHSAFKDLIDQYFDERTFETELRCLPGRFAPPRGRLLVATSSGNFMGCVALRPAGDDVCEMKRLFVRSEYQGQGAGMSLAQALIKEAKEIGYRLMRLDTGPNSIEAKDIYRKLGFKEIEPYYDVDKRMEDWLTFMELVL